MPRDGVKQEDNAVKARGPGDHRPGPTPKYVNPNAPGSRALAVRVSLRDAGLTTVGNAGEGALMCVETPSPRGVGLGTETLT